MSLPESVPYKVSLDVARQLLLVGQELGIDVDAHLRRQGLALTPLPQQPGFVAGPLMEKILASGLRLLQDPLPGLYAARLRVASLFGLAGFLVQTTSSVGTLLDTVLRVEPLVGDAGITRLRREPGAVLLSWDCRFQDSYVRRHASEFMLACFNWALQPAAQHGLRVIEAVHFRHAPPEDPALLRRYLDSFGCPVYFRQPECRLLLRPDALDLPLPTANPMLYDVLEQHARKLLEEDRQSSTIVDLTRSHLHQLLQQGEPSREKLAAVMDLCPRTLHRRLREAGTTYRELLDELRLERARQLLREGALSVQEVAARAGFGEGPSFSRWFRQQTGVTPSEFREQVMVAEGGVSD